MPKSEGEKRRRRRRQRRLRYEARILSWKPPAYVPLATDPEEAELLEAQRELLKEIADGDPSRDS